MKARAMVALLAPLATTLALAGCAAEATPEEPEETNEEAPAADAAAANAAAGRDTSPFSCLAACQNATLTCSVRGATAAPAYLEIEQNGCRGEITRAKGSEKLTVDCNTGKVCVGATCSDGTFSATTLAWSDLVCVRD